MSNPITDADIPPLERHCGSWIVVRKSNGEPAMEIFERKNLYKFDRGKVVILTTLQWLCAFNWAVTLS